MALSKSLKINKVISLKIASIFFIIVLLFNTQWIFEILNTDPLPTPLTLNSVKNSDNIEIKGRLYLKYIQTQDVLSAKWLSHYGIISKKIYADYGWGHGLAPLKTYGKLLNSIYWFPQNISDISNESYIYLYCVNIKEHINFKINRKLGIVKFEYFEYSSINKNKIYDSGGSQIFY
jgi:uncharacterized membrane protein